MKTNKVIAALMAASVATNYVPFNVLADEVKDPNNIETQTNNSDQDITSTDPVVQEDTTQQEEQAQPQDNGVATQSAVSTQTTIDSKIISVDGNSVYTTKNLKKELNLGIGVYRLIGKDAMGNDLSLDFEVSLGLISKPINIKGTYKLERYVNKGTNRKPDYQWDVIVKNLSFDVSYNVGVTYTSNVYEGVKIVDVNTGAEITNNSKIHVGTPITFKVNDVSGDYNYAITGDGVTDNGNGTYTLTSDYKNVSVNIDCTEVGKVKHTIRKNEHVSKVLIDGNEVGDTIDLKPGDHTIQAEAYDKYVINGIKVGDTYLQPDENGVYTFTTDENEQTITIETTATFATVTLDAEHAKFKDEQSNEFNGGNVELDKNSDYKFKVIPESDDYEVKSVTFNGETIQPDEDGYYTVHIGEDDNYNVKATTNVTYATVKVTKKRNVGDVTINGNNSSSVKVKANEEYTIVAKSKDSKHYISSIIVDGKEYTSKNITYNESHDAVLKVMAGDKGSISNVEIHADDVLKGNNTTKVNFNEFYGDDEMAEVEQNIIDAVVNESSAPWAYNDKSNMQAYLTLKNRRISELKAEELKNIVGGNGILVTVKYGESSVTSYVTLEDTRIEVPTIEVNSDVTVKYNTEDKLNDALYEALNPIVKDEKTSEIIPSSREDFTFSYTRELGEQKVVVEYRGNKCYKKTTLETTVTITKGVATVKVNSQNIKVGEEFQQIFSCDPKEANVVGIIAGVDYTGKSFISLDISETNYSILANALGGELNLNSLKTLHDSLNKNKDFINSLLGNNFVENFNKIYDAILQIPGLDNFNLLINKKPQTAGVYTAAGVSTSKNYETTADIGYLTITRKDAAIRLETSDVDTTYDGTSHGLSAKVVDGDGNEIPDAVVDIRYVGLDAATGKAYASSEAPVDVGAYTAFVTYGGSDTEHPALSVNGSVIIRKSDKQVTLNVTDDNTVYGELGENHSHNVSANLSDGSTTEFNGHEVSRIVNATTVNCKVDSSTDVGEYPVTASVDKSITRNYYKKFVINKGTHTVSQKELSFIPSSSIDTTYGEDWSLGAFEVKDGENTVTDESVINSLNIDVHYEDLEGNKISKPTDAGDYQAVYTYNNPNYNLTGTFTTDIHIEPRTITVSVVTDSIEREYLVDKDFNGVAIDAKEYALYDGENEIIEKADLDKIGADVDVEYYRVNEDESETKVDKVIDVGTYKAKFIPKSINSNYKFAEMTSNERDIVITPKKVTYVAGLPSLKKYDDKKIDLKGDYGFNYNGNDMAAEEITKMNPEISVEYYSVDTDGNETHMDSNPVNAGKYCAKFNLVGINSNYTLGENDELEVRDITIEQKDINDSTITVNKPSDVKQDGKEHKFVPEVKDSETESTLVEGTDYTVSYSGDFKLGKVTVTITGIGNYTGIRSMSYTITKDEPKKPDSSKKDDSKKDSSKKNKSVDTGIESSIGVASLAAAASALGAYNARKKLSRVEKNKHKYRH